MDKLNIKNTTTTTGSRELPVLVALRLYIMIYRTSAKIVFPDVGAIPFLYNKIIGYSPYMRGILI